MNHDVGAYSKTHSSYVSLYRPVLRYTRTKAGIHRDTENRSSVIQPCLPASYPSILVPTTQTQTQPAIGRTGRTVLRHANSENVIYRNPTPSMYRSQPCVNDSEPSLKQFSLDNFSKLSDEVVMSVFQWLPPSVLCQCAQVCRRWSRLSKYYRFWRNLDLGGKKITVQVLLDILARGMKVLRLAKAELFVDSLTQIQGALNVAPRKPYRIQYLDLSMSVGCSARLLTHVLQNSPFLVALSLEGLVVDSQCCACFSRLNNLELLNLTICHGIGDSDVINLFKNNKKLIEVNMSWCNLSKTAVINAISHFPNSLEKLNLSGCRNNLDDHGVKLLALSCPNLVELDLSDCSNITGISVDYICDGFKKLTKLSLSRCYSIDPSAYMFLPRQLKEINIFGNLTEESFNLLKVRLNTDAVFNQYPFSVIARPTVGVRRTSIWSIRTRDE